MTWRSVSQVVIQLIQVVNEGKEVAWLRKFSLTYLLIAHLMDVGKRTGFELSFLSRSPPRQAQNGISTRIQDH
jgi:hypothetical protein